MILHIFSLKTYCAYPKHLMSIYVLVVLSIISAEVNAQQQYVEVSLPELMKKMAAGDKNLVVLDVRTKGEYSDTVSDGMQSNIGRIKGAINVELKDLRDRPETVKSLEAYKDKEIYIICSHSYRSRSASRILLNNGFTHVNNVRGGMTDWYRHYDDLLPYRKEFLEGTLHYGNMSPAQLYNGLAAGKKIMIIGVNNRPMHYYDSFNIQMNRYYPSFRSAVYYDFSDSLKLLSDIRQKPGTTVVLFNMVNIGAAELADWLTTKGIYDVNYLVGGNSYFYEYIDNAGLRSKAVPMMETKSRIEFMTADNLCRSLNNREELVCVDIRHDTLFNAITDGVKYDYKYLKNSINFFEGQGIDAFEKAFPDKQKHYVIVSSMGVDGLPFADALASKGYKVSWLMGGLHRWEWYMNNSERFECNDWLVK